MRMGCRYGLPHDMKNVHETKRVIWEVCQICNKKYRWNKSHKGRINNTKYLKVHLRNYAQKFGATKRVYHKIYRPNEMKIII